MVVAVMVLFGWSGEDKVDEVLVRQIGEGQMLGGVLSDLACEKESIAILFSYRATERVERSEAFLSGGRMMRKGRRFLVLSVGDAE